MNSRKSAWPVKVIVLSLLLGLLLQTNPQLAHSQVPDTSNYLLWLTPPAGVPPAEMPAQLLPSFYLSQIDAHVDRLSPQLESMVARGRIAGFTPLPGANAILVRAFEAGDYRFAQERLPGVVRITAAGAPQIEAAQHAFASTWQPSVALQQAGTNPSVFVNETYNRVYGVTDQSASVSVTLRDSGGSVKESYSTLADQVGYYTVDFLYADVIPGDLVDVSAYYTTTRAIRYTVDALTVQIDRASDYVFGTAPPGRTMYAYLWQDYGTCLTQSGSEWIDSGSGSYSVSFATVPDIVNGAYSYVYVYDANGNATVVYRYAPVLWVDHWNNGIRGYFEPDATVTASLKDTGGWTWETVSSGTAQYDGYYDVDFSTPFPTGGQVEVTHDGETLVMPVLDLNGSLDPDADAIYGTAHAPGAPVRVQAHTDA